ncbi:hypothetical protein X801_10814, partial [Opisthorchis viverrini]
TDLDACAPGALSDPTNTLPPPPPTYPRTFNLESHLDCSCDYVRADPGLWPAEVWYERNFHTVDRCTCPHDEVHRYFDNAAASWKLADTIAMLPLRETEIIDDLVDSTSEDEEEESKRLEEFGQTEEKKSADGEKSPARHPQSDSATLSSEGTENRQMDSSDEFSKDLINKEHLSDSSSKRHELSSNVCKEDQEEPLTLEDLVPSKGLVPDSLKDSPSLRLTTLERMSSETLAVRTNEKPSPSRALHKLSSSDSGCSSGLDKKALPTAEQNECISPGPVLAKTGDQHELETRPHVAQPPCEMDNDMKQVKPISLDHEKKRTKTERIPSDSSQRENGAATLSIFNNVKPDFRGPYKPAMSAVRSDSQPEQGLTAFVGHLQVESVAAALDKLHVGMRNVIEGSLDKIAAFQQSLVEDNKPSVVTRQTSVSRAQSVEPADGHTKASDATINNEAEPELDLKEPESDLDLNEWLADSNDSSLSDYPPEMSEGELEDMREHRGRRYPPRDKPVGEESASPERDSDRYLPPFATSSHEASHTCTSSTKSFDQKPVREQTDPHQRALRRWAILREHVNSILE